MCYIYKAIMLVFFAVAANPVYAAVEISEIMYDNPGSDTGREWFEVYNNSATSIDMAEYAFSDGSSHSIRLPEQSSASLTLGAYAYAVVAANAGKFLKDNPEFTGLLYISSFSLKNTGATIAISKGTTKEFEYTYSGELGAQGDGNTLQNDSGVWKALSATPGEGRLVMNTSTGEPNEKEGALTPAPSSGGANTFIEPTLFAAVRTKKDAFIGLETSFEGVALGKEGILQGNVRYIWNFGDATLAEGKKVFHTYRQKGVYSSTLTVQSGEHSATAFIDILVSAPKISYVELEKGDNGYIGLQNLSGQELSLERLGLRNAKFATSSQGVPAFYFPENTKIKAKNILRVAMGTLGFYATETLQLLDPGGRPIQMLFYESEQVTKNSIELKPVPIVKKDPQKEKTKELPSVIIEEKKPTLLEAAPAATFKSIKNSRERNMRYILFAGLSIVLLSVLCARIFLKKK